MDKIRFTLLKSLFFLVLLTACTSPKKMVYFQGAAAEEVQEVLLDYEPKIQAGDLITIHVSGIDTTAAAIFNIYEGTGVGTPIKVPYLVNKEGTINFPVLGAIKAKGLTTLQLTNYLEFKGIPCKTHCKYSVD